MFATNDYSLLLFVLYTTLLVAVGESYEGRTTSNYRVLNSYTIFFSELCIILCRECFGCLSLLGVCPLPDIDAWRADLRRYLTLGRDLYLDDVGTLTATTLRLPRDLADLEVTDVPSLRNYLCLLQTAVVDRVQSIAELQARLVDAQEEHQQAKALVAALRQQHDVLHKAGTIAIDLRTKNKELRVRLESRKAKQRAAEDRAGKLSEELKGARESFKVAQESHLEELRKAKSLNANLLDKLYGMRALGPGSPSALRSEYGTLLANATQEIARLRALLAGLRTREQEIRSRRTRAARMLLFAVCILWQHARRLGEHLARTRLDANAVRFQLSVLLEDLKPLAESAHGQDNGSDLSTLVGRTVTLQKTHASEMSQLTLQYDAALAGRKRDLREFLAHRTRAAVRHRATTKRLLVCLLILWRFNGCLSRRPAHTQTKAQTHLVAQAPVGAVSRVWLGPRSVRNDVVLSTRDDQKKTSYPSANDPATAEAPHVDSQRTGPNKLVERFDDLQRRFIALRQEHNHTQASLHKAVNVAVGVLQDREYAAVALDTFRAAMDDEDRDALWDLWANGADSKAQVASQPLETRTQDPAAASFTSVSGGRECGLSAGTLAPCLGAQNLDMRSVTPAKDVRKSVEGARLRPPASGSGTPAGPCATPTHPSVLGPTPFNADNSPQPQVHCAFVRRPRTVTGPFPPPLSSPRNGGFVTFAPFEDDLSGSSRSRVPVSLAVKSSSSERTAPLNPLANEFLGCSTPRRLPPVVGGQPVPAPVSSVIKPASPIDPALARAFCANLHRSFPGGPYEFVPRGILHSEQSHPPSSPLPPPPIPIDGPPDADVAPDYLDAQLLEPHLPGISPMLHYRGLFAVPPFVPMDRPEPPHGLHAGCAQPLRTR
ncbi:hypothetical protein B0H21DRAFT_719672 [Amylocystis lapponica]|nr:hypothetical protein B0H21DRAFT_719672 [Amylocystis lapponica]